jgi:hypothetical protein
LLGEQYILFMQEEGKEVQKKRNTKAETVPIETNV